MTYVGAHTLLTKHCLKSKENWKYFICDSAEKCTKTQITDYMCIIYFCLGTIKDTNHCVMTKYLFKMPLKIVNEYDQEIPQSQTADNPVAPRGRAVQPSQDTRKTN